MERRSVRALPARRSDDLAVNVPLNDAIKAAGRPDQISDLGAVRARFDEHRWVRWNVARTFMSFASFGCLLWALVELGRSM